MIKTGKLILLSSIGALAAVYILQTIFSPAQTAKSIELKDSPDSFTITASGGKPIHLAKEGDNWTVGEKKYKADGAQIESLVSSVESLKQLGIVSGGGDAERYGLGTDEALTVILSKDEKELLSLEIGKESPTARQSYVRINKGKDIVLVSENLKELFGKPEENFRDRTIFALSADTLISVQLSGSVTYSLSKSGTPPVWGIASAGGQTAAAPKELDADKTGAWVNTLVSLSAASFLSDDTPLPAAANQTAVLDFGIKKITVSLFGKREDGQYTAVCSENPSPFLLNAYTAERFLKPLADISK